MAGATTEKARPRQTTQRSCLVCGRGGPFPLKYTRYGFRLVSCPSCGLVFQDPQPTDEQLAATYYHDPEWTQVMLGPMRELFTGRAREQVGYLESAGIRPPGRLLDVGCASGRFLDVAAQAGWQATGVEIGEATAQAARDEGLDVLTGTLRDARPALEPGAFKVVTFWDVLEHVRNPREELGLARELLRPRGRLAATMPNVAGLYPRATYQLLARTTGRWEYPELPVHLHDFDPTTMTRLLEDTGFRDVQVHTVATPFWYYRATTLAVHNLGGPRRGPVLRLAFEALHAVLYPLARLTDRQNTLRVVATKAA
jgi:2-polyprenyl-3-methyl-5-hydroxy-6-metoxy-1,4-benzoquinol methylase